MAAAASPPASQSTAAKRRAADMAANSDPEPAQQDTHISSRKKAKDAALRNPKIHAELWANEVGYQVDFEELEKYPIRLTKFSDYLEKHRDEVIQTFA